jgi:hypothetical protein
MRRQLSVPVSLMVIIVGAVLSYYILHANGWSWNGSVALADVYRRLSMASRVLVIAGFIMNAWGLGSLLSSLLSALAGRRSEGPPS